MTQAPDSTSDEELTPRWKRIAAVHAKQSGARDGDLVRIEGEQGDWIIDGMTVSPVPTGEEMDWIKAEHAPGNLYGLVWVANGGNDGKGSVEFGMINRYPDGDIFPVVRGYSGDFSVTHWMPLPPRPPPCDRGDDGTTVKPAPPKP